MTDEPAVDPAPVGTLWVLDIERDLPNSTPVVPRVEATFRRAGVEDAALLAEAMALDRATMAQRFNSRRRCYIALVGGVLATYGWVSFEEEWINELGLTIHLAPGDAYIWDCASIPAYRGQGLYPALLVHIATELRADGTRRVWIGADTGSTASQRGIVRAGFQPVADAYLAPSSPDGPLYVSGRAGVAEDLVQAVRRALLS